MTTSNYPQYLISAVDDEQAQEFAKVNGFDEGAWFRLPSTLNDDTEAFIQDTTPVLDKEVLKAMTKDEYAESRLVDSRNSRILFAKDLSTASKYASKRNWWLHAWKFVADPELEEVIEYSFYC